MNRVGQNALNIILGVLKCNISQNEIFHSEFRYRSKRQSKVQLLQKKFFKLSFLVTLNKYEYIFK